MTRRPNAFKASDLTRAYKAADEAGLPVMRTEIDRDGKIIIIHQAPPTSEPNNSFDAWRAKHAD